MIQSLRRHRHTDTARKLVFEALQARQLMAIDTVDGLVPTDLGVDTPDMVSAKVAASTPIAVSLNQTQAPQPDQSSVTISARAVDADNKVLKSVAMEDEFWVEILVQDRRHNAKGVFSTYLDLTFDTSAFEINGKAIPMSYYTNGLRGEKSASGWKNLGGFSNSISPVGPDVQPLVRFKLKATEDKAFEMSMTKSNGNLFDSATSVYGLNGAVPDSNLTFGTLSIPLRMLPPQDSVKPQPSDSRSETFPNNDVSSETVSDEDFEPSLPIPMMNTIESNTSETSEQKKKKSA
jgi:hypothetical protein